MWPPRCAVGCVGDGILQHCLRTSSSISDAFSCLRRWHVVMLEAVKHQEPAVPASYDEESRYGRAVTLPFPTVGVHSGETTSFVACRASFSARGSAAFLQRSSRGQPPSARSGHPRGNQPSQPAHLKRRPLRLSFNPRLCSLDISCDRGGLRR